MADRVYNFSAGPATLPLQALEKAQEELVKYQNTGMSVMEMSHRSKQFGAIINSAEARLRRLLNIPDNYGVLFLQGGGRHQFAMVPLNLYQEGRPVDVLHTGSWTKQAIVEMEKVAEYRIAGSGESNRFTKIPEPGDITFKADASYVYMASNNTIYGTQWKHFPDTGDVPLVCDMSSDILSRKINVSQFGLIFAGAQKNCGPAGVTIVIIRKDLIEDGRRSIPPILQYRSHYEKQSLYNTAPTFAIYMVGLVLEWLEGEGGIEAIAAQNRSKAKVLYEAIDNSSFYTSPVRLPDRSEMNVVFRIKDGDEALEKKFIQLAEEGGLSGLKGHRSVGGLRASIYNAMTMDGVNALVSFMETFEKSHT